MAGSALVSGELCLTGAWGAGCGGLQESVLIAIDLAVRTFNRIRLNYVWAMGYNLLMIPVAAGALYPPLHFQMPPWIAGACMALSSVTVVFSSLLLHRYRPPRPASGGGSQDSAGGGVEGA